MMDDGCQMSDGFPFRLLTSEICHLSLRPRRDRRRTFHDRPFVVRRVEHREAVLPVVFPGRAVAILRQFPGAFTLRARLADRLARRVKAPGNCRRMATA